MTADVLEPRIELLKEEYVLVQAWKKTASYIRYHNWYADTLTLDRIAVNLTQFLAEIAAQLKTPEQWVNDPLRIVLAPKSQQWRVIQDPIRNKRWEPVIGGKTAANLRPLAHVSIRDQVVATAVMLCLADRVETRQGRSRAPVEDAEARKRVISYGNRLFCDEYGSELRHRWGSVKLYRSYYQDYRSFIERPEGIKSWGRVLQSNISWRGAGLSADSSFGSPLSSFADDRASWLARYASRTTALWERGRVLALRKNYWGSIEAFCAMRSADRCCLESGVPSSTRGTLTP